MASGAFIIPNKAKLNIIGPTGILTQTLANLRLALVKSAFTPDDTDTGNEVWADVSAQEIANGQGYTTGGIAIPAAALSLASGVVKFTGTVATWTATGTGIPAWRYAYIYYLGTLNSKVNPLLCHFVGDSTPADVPLTTAGNPLTITPSGSGIIAAT